MMLEDRFFEQEWVQELSNESFRMLLYLLHYASKKTGIIELNMRQINFAANTGRMFTIDDILSEFGNMIKMLPGRKSTAIFPEYIAINWAKNGKPIDTVKNPLFKSIVQELASFGLTIDDVNELSSKQITVKDTFGELIPKTTAEPVKVAASPSVNLDEMFDEFWKSYPSSCPRKVDKKKCRDKYMNILKSSKDPEVMHNRILGGLEIWKVSDTWTKENGQFIRAPMVWLNGRNWEDAPIKGGFNGNSKNGTANANYKGTGASDIF